MSKEQNMGQSLDKVMGYSMEEWRAAYRKWMLLENPVPYKKQGVPGEENEK